MNNNTVSGNLDRIKRATDDMRLTTGTVGEDIETVAQAVSDLNDENIAQAEEIADLEQQVEELTPSGSIEITNNGITNVAGYQYADVNVALDLSEAFETTEPLRPGEQWQTIAGAMRSIKKVPAFTFNQENASLLFGNMEYLTEVDLANFNTANTVSFNGIFTNCRRLKRVLNAQGLDTSKVSDMTDAFRASGLEDYSFLKNWNTSSLTNMTRTFYGIAAEELDLTNWNLDNVTNADNLFRQESEGSSSGGVEFHNTLRRIKLPNKKNFGQLTNASYMLSNTKLDNFEEVLARIDFSHVTNAGGLFSHCTYPKIDLSNTNFAHVQILDNMFSYTWGCNEIDFSGITSSEITSMRDMFYQYGGITQLDLAHLTTPNLRNIQGLFNIQALLKADIRNFTFDNVTSYADLFGPSWSQQHPTTTMEIIVKSQTEKDWFNTNFPAYTNVKTVVEYTNNPGYIFSVIPDLNHARGGSNFTVKLYDYSSGSREDILYETYNQSGTTPKGCVLNQDEITSITSVMFEISYGDGYGGTIYYYSEPINLISGVYTYQVTISEGGNN